MELIDRITRQNPWWENKKVENLEKIKPRKLFKELLESKEDKQIISIVGLRRTGKTTLMYQIIESLIGEVEPKKILYFSFDEIIGKDPSIIEKILEIYEEEILKEELKDIYVFFDEINHVNDWQVILKRFYDLGRVKFFVSGSAGVILKKAKESLAGRIYEFELKPLSFGEYLELKNIKINNLAADRLKIKRELSNYLISGGFPEMINEDSLEKISAYVKSVVEKVIFYDLPKIFDIAEPEILKEIFESIARNPGALVEYSSLALRLKISYQTASKYINYLEKAFLIQLLYNYRGSPVARARKLKKAYLSSPTLALAFLLEKEFLSLIPKFVENAVANFLEAKFFWRKYYEVDILQENTPIEIKYRKEPRIKGALETAKKLKAKKLLVITKDTEKTTQKDKIKIYYIPLWKFLLNNKSKEF